MLMPLFSKETPNSTCCMHLSCVSTYCLSFLSFTINFFPPFLFITFLKESSSHPPVFSYLPTASLIINGPIVLEHGLHVAPTSRAGMWWWHCCVLFLSLFTNRRRPNWSMPALRSLNRACSLKRPKLTNFRES